jgi:pilus assembly protein Flp/PilA
VNGIPTNVDSENIIEIILFSVKIPLKENRRKEKFVEALAPGGDGCRGKVAGLPGLSLEMANPLRNGDAKPWVRRIRGGSPGYRKVRTMKKVMIWVRNLLDKEDGPTAVEYAVMLALIIVVCIAAITALGSNANQTFTTVGNAIGTAS